MTQLLTSNKSRGLTFKVIQLITSVLFALQVFTVHADVYEYVDAQGVSHYSNVPTDPRYHLIIEVPVLAQQEQANHLKTNRSKNAGVQQKRLTTVAPALSSVALTKQIKQSAEKHQIDAALIQAVMHVESAYKTKARSHKGAQGLMQLMPATAKRFGVKDSYDPVQNIEGGAKYLRVLLDLFNNDISLALAGYNAGEHAVIKYGKTIPPYKETQAYVPKVLSIYESLLKKRSI